MDFILDSPGGDSDRKIREALAQIVSGRTVKRAVHSLEYEGRDITPMFVAELLNQGYTPTKVAAVPVRPGERVPAFYIDGKIAYFGWVFWEQFTSWKIRKLWGSVVRNARGDWEFQIPDKGSSIIHANSSLKIEMDIDHPSDF
ncbi:MAG TPA: hypothetical protein VJO14_06970 [Bacteroidota bacterium]|nr:hypothetical protein [Bacteroidota bacterium]